MTQDTNTASGAADLALRLRNACTSVRSKSYPLADLIQLMQQAADALAYTPAQPVAEPADTVVLNAAMRAIQQAIELIGDPTDERMRAVRRVLRGAVIVAEDAGEVALRKASELERVLVDQLRDFADRTYAMRASRGQAPATVQADSVQEDALSDAVRVPLDSLHADAAYLIGRLRDGSMPYARVIEIIRERIDAAKAAIRARAAHGQAPAPAESVTAPGGGVVAAGRFMDEAAERRSAQEGYENRIKRASERNPHDEGMYSLGWWDRAWKAAAPTPAAQAADSVQEDAARLDWLLLRISGAEFRRLGVHYSGNARRADVDAARKQGEKQ